MGVSDVLYARFVAILDECRILGDVPACRGSFSEKRRHLPGQLYQGRSQEKYLSHGRMFSCFPARMNEQDLFQPSAPGARFAAHCCVAVLVFTPSGFHRKFATRPVCSETNKQSGDQVLTMALLGTRGPQLFRMMRGG